MKTLRVIGRREFLKLPELSNLFIEAKVDTGAYRSCIHVESCREITDNGRKVLEAVFAVDDSGPQKHIFENYRELLVRNSFGDSEMRFCVRTVLQLGNKKIRSEVSLANRSGMRYQVLIGRKTIQNKFLVDVGKKYVLSRTRRD